MHSKAFSDIRALLTGKPEEAPATYAAYLVYKDWYLLMLNSFHDLIPFDMGLEERDEIWDILRPYLEPHPNLLKTLAGMEASRAVARGRMDSLTPSTAYALTAYHQGLETIHMKGLMQWVACHFPYDLPPKNYKKPEYKGPFPISNYNIFGHDLSRHNIISSTVFGGDFANRALTYGNRDVFVAVHKASDFYEDLRQGFLTGYTKEYVLSEKGNDWSSYSEGRWDYDPDHEYCPEKRLEALQWKYDHNIYATVLVDDKGFMTYLPDVCYDLPLDENERGWFYDCYE